MTTLSTRLGLKKHTTADTFRIQDYVDNWDKLDQYPGIYICTSITRPTWGPAQDGMRIFETDTRLEWVWTTGGTVWARTRPAGWLGSGERSTNLTNSAAGTYATLVTATVTVPAGNRNVLVVVEGSSVINTVGITQFSIWRDATLVQEWMIPSGGGSGAAQQDRGISMSALDAPSAGSGQNYMLKFRPVVGFGGTSTVTAGVNTPCAIHVIEV